MKRVLAVASLISMLCVAAYAQKNGPRFSATTQHSTAVQPERWASPLELRMKKFLGGGLYTTTGGETAVTPRFLATHPDFLNSYPFDGIIFPAPIDPDLLKGLGFPPGYGSLHEHVWNTVELPYDAIAPTVKDLKSISWGTVTDNFLVLGLIEGSRGRFIPDLASDHDWAILEHNAALAARLCREGNLKGFWLDTEQYGTYRWRSATGTPEFDADKPKGIPFPFGKDTPEVLRRRGAQWIKAVQAELPAVKIIIPFAWSDDANGYGPLKGIILFLDGVLDGIMAPGEMIHGYENTFYYGQGPGTTHAANDGKKDGFPGGREKYESARATIHNWRALSANPGKYDKFLKVGMAAWVEDHPWNNPEGWPSGTKASLWSNLPLALAYTDEYVWVWSEHTKYGQEGHTDVNPFLASLRNQTFNTGREPVDALTEDFATDPLQRGWYFDFNMLDIGRKKEPAHEAAIMSPDAVPYRWSSDDRAVRIQSNWMTGQNGDQVARLGPQRRRYVHPIQPLNGKQSFEAELDFQIDAFGSDPANPIIFGLFNSDAPVNQQSITLRIDGPDAVFVTVAGDGKPWVSKLAVAGDGKPWVSKLAVAGGLSAAKEYRLSLGYESEKGQLVARLLDPRDSMVVAQVNEAIPAAAGQYELDELGAAMWDAEPTATPPEKAYRYRLERVALQRK